MQNNVEKDNSFQLDDRCSNGRGWVDPRNVKSGCVISDLNGYYDSQNIVAINDGYASKQKILSVVLHHSYSHEKFFWNL